MTYRSSIQHGDLLSWVPPPWSCASPHLVSEVSQHLLMHLGGSDSQYDHKVLCLATISEANLLRTNCILGNRERKTFPPVYFSCLPLSQSVESTAWNCLENLIRSHSAKHIVSRGWEIVTIGSSMKNGSCGGRTKIKLRWLRNILTKIMFDLPSRALSSRCLRECLHGELKSVQGLFWIDSAPRADVSCWGVRKAMETFQLARRPFWWIWEEQAWRNKKKNHLTVWVFPLFFRSCT